MIGGSSKYQAVIDILNSKSHDLVYLAGVTGREIFRFYNGADLSGLDLSNQDLRGLNFDRSDIRFSNLENATFDSGAFNGSLTDDTQDWLKDEFEFYFNDLAEHDNNSILLFFRIREGMIDDLILRAGLSYREFSQHADVSTAALRKARNGGVVAHDTALRVARAYQSIGESIDDVSFSKAATRQPFIQILSGGNNGRFYNVNRSDLDNIRYQKEIIDAIRVLRHPGSKPYRDTPESLRFLFEYYSKFIFHTQELESYDDVEPS